MIGLAMIVRNGAITMVEAIEPFLQVVDEISIVLGGDSEDATPEIAQEYATVLSSYQGHPEYPFHFGDCRQQSFDQMGADWVVVVDADDIWQGVEHLPDLIKEMTERDANGAYVLYNLNESSFYQPRVFRRSLGKWVGAVHEKCELPPQSRVIKTDALTVTQKVDAHRRQRNQQNIDIGTRVIEQEPNNTRAIAHLVEDYRAGGNLDKVLDLSGCYLSKFEHAPAHCRNEYFRVLHAKAESELLQGDCDAGMCTALEMLKVRPGAASWVVFAESCQRASNGSEALLRLAVFASEQAMFSTKSDDNQLWRPDLSSSVPCLIKALALHELGNDGGAIQMINLGLMIDPHHEQLLSVHRQLSEKIERQKYDS